MEKNSNQRWIKKRKYNCHTSLPSSWLTLPRPIEPDDVKRLLRKRFTPRDKCMLLMLLRTGMRIGEMLALKWSDIDFENRLIEVKRNLTRRGFSRPKNNKTRHVDMTPLLADVLKKSQIDQKKWALKNRCHVPEFVFTRENGEHQIHQNFKN